MKLKQSKRGDYRCFFFDLRGRREFGDTSSSGPGSTKCCSLEDDVKSRVGVEQGICPELWRYLIDGSPHRNANLLSVFALEVED